MNTKTAEERAAERFPAFKVMDWTRRQDGCATCIREEVEPLEERILDLQAALELKAEENAKLRALVQELVNGCDEACQSLWSYRGSYDDVKNNLPKCLSGFAAAKEHGFVPTNTKEDNG